ncbi:MAG: acetyl-CoA carboxylase biotin carboxyl carrier protein subunit [Bryobacteraceae bacterium]
MAPAMELETERESRQAIGEQSRQAIAEQSRQAIGKQSRQAIGERTRILIAAATAAVVGSPFRVLEIGLVARAGRGRLETSRRPRPEAGHARLLSASKWALRRPARRRKVRLRITLEDSSYDVAVEVLAEPEAAWVQDLPLAAVPESVLQPPRPLDIRPEDKICRSPIAGMVVSVEASPRQWVRQDDPVVTIEAMKMQNTIGAPVEGVVEEILVKPGEAVRTGQVLCKLS